MADKNRNGHFHVWLMKSLPSNDYVLVRDERCYDNRNLARTALNRHRFNGLVGEARSVRTWEWCYQNENDANLDFRRRQAHDNSERYFKSITQYPVQ